MFVVGNWKMNGSLSLCDDFIKNLKFRENCVICSPYIYLYRFMGAGITVGSQDCSQFKNGSYTGDISCEMLSKFGIKYAIIGHSERVKLYQETKQIILQKTYSCVENAIKPIVCIDNNFEELLREFIHIHDKIIIAYEPATAIGTGVIPTNEEILDVVKKIKSLGQFTMLYGGSVNSKNIDTLKSIQQIDGFLVGGASLKVDEFNKIIESVKE